MSDDTPSRHTDGCDESTGPLPERPQQPGASLVGRTIGHFRITREIGRGGMGVVYEARQHHPRRTVALKVINPGVASPAMLRRFQNEADFLARLQHANIAYVYDAGTFDAGAGEQPYFAMEFVHGRRLLQYAEQYNPSTRRRLELLAKICYAIDYAHQKGVIHRDLKPGNIVVTDEGEPKILDFGVARATDSDFQTTTLRTDIGQLIGTIPYMSPEQAGGNPDDLDTRSDVYALGVVAYELLSGKLPYDVRQKMIHEAVRTIIEDDPAPLSSINHTLRGDIEIIIGKALAKEKERRYQSAREFAADIERYLNDEPIIARPPSTSYQLRKFARRNKALVVGAAAAFVILIAALFALTAMYLRAEAEAHRALAAEAEAERRADDLETVAAFQETHLAGFHAELMGADLRRAILDRYGDALEHTGGDSSDTQQRLALLEQSLALVNFTGIALGALDRHVFDRAITAIETQFEDRPLIRARLLQTVADTARQLGLFECAEPAQIEALELRRRELGDLHPDTLASVNSTGVLFEAMGRYDDAERFLREAMEGRRRVLGQAHPDTLSSISNIGSLYEARRELDKAERYLLEALDGLGRIRGEDHEDTLKVRNNLAAVRWAQRRFDEAEDHLRAVLDGYRRRYGDDHPHTVTVVNNIGVLLLQRGSPDEAEPYLLEALEARRRVLGDGNHETIGAIISMGGLLRELGRLEEAERLCAEAVRAARRSLPPAHWQTAMSLGQHSRTLMNMERFEEAAPLALEALAIFESIGEPARAAILGTIGYLAEFYDRWHEHDPQAGHDQSAAQWRERLAAARADGGG